MLKEMTGRPLTFSLLVLTLLYIPVFYTDYAYLDEAYQLWHNKDHADYTDIAAQGRWLMAVLFDKSFGALSTIAELKILRIVSFFILALFLFEFIRLAKIWKQLITLSDELIFISGIYIACSLSVAVYIGWASSFEAGIGLLTGLWSGHLLFMHLIKKEKSNATTIARLATMVVLGVCTLFLYQIAFGAFLIPFAFYLLSKKSFADRKIIITAAAVYLAIQAVYYLIFLLSQKMGGLPASDRTELTTNIAGKIGFFFGIPLSQAFSFNFLYNLHSVPSQAFPILMIACWVIHYFVTAKDRLVNKAAFIIAFFMLCVLMYIPVLVAKENFASYRTMFVFNLTASIFLFDVFLFAAKSDNAKTTVSILLAACFVSVGYWNFRNNFIRPLEKEYSLLKQSFNENYQPGTHTVYFLRPPENLFYTHYGIHSYKDEFGVPSAFKDWTPEALIKQLALEKTGSRPAAEKINVVQFTDRAGFESAKKNKTPRNMYFDPESLFK